MKYAIVTGATKGIGLGIARMLLDEGYFVTLTYAHDENAATLCREQLSEWTGSFEILKVDQADKEAMKVFAQAMRMKPSIDCLVCNTGTTLRKSLSETTDEDWERVMQVNVNSNVYLVRDLFDKFSMDSRIVFIGSLMAIRPHATSLAYGVTKAALHALALNLVKCFEGTGTTVNAIAPGFVETEWQKDKPQEIRENIYKKTAIKRFASIDEIVDAVRFCIRNAFVNGSVIEISGGYSFK